MSDYEVTLVNDNMQEFYVRFDGPTDSKYIGWQMDSENKVECIDNAFFFSLKHHSLEAYGKSMLNYLINILTNHRVLVS